MLINTPISLGELVDKISILMIKKKNISDIIKLQHVKKELEFLQKTLKKYISEEEINYLIKHLLILHEVCILPMTKEQK